ncbi:MAG: hypothetical protein E3J35_04210 [Methanomassiliicoccales archaeon]|nr:MAG: hypothetical protein E3J35_04210 [Methanomassiliicoccales archaeon]
MLNLTENLARDSLTPIEEANAYAEYLGVDADLVSIPSDHDPTLMEFAKRIGVSPSVMSKRIALLTLPKKVQKLVEEDKHLGSLVNPDE